MVCEGGHLPRRWWHLLHTRVVIIILSTQQVGKAEHLVGYEHVDGRRVGPIGRPTSYPDGIFARTFCDCHFGPGFAPETGAKIRQKRFATHDAHESFRTWANFLPRVGTLVSSVTHFENFPSTTLRLWASALRRRSRNYCCADTPMSVCECVCVWWWATIILGMNECVCVCVCSLYYTYSYTE